MSPDQIARLIEVAAEATGLSPHTIGRHASGKGDFYARLKHGRDVTTRRAARVVLIGVEYAPPYWRGPLGPDSFMRRF